MKHLSIRRCLPTIACLLFTGACLAQDPQQAPPPGPPQANMIQQKMQQMQQATARNEQQLHTYQWIETATATIDGNTKPARQSICRYAPDGTLHKTPLGAPSQPPAARGGPLRRMMMEKKIQEVQDEMAEVHALVGMYLPPNREKLREAFEAHKLTFETNGSGSNAIVIHDYVKPGDELRLMLNVSTMQIQHIIVKSYFEMPNDIMTATVEFSSLGDGTIYPSMTTVNAPSKKLALTTLSSDFSKVVY